VAGSRKGIPNKIGAAVKSNLIAVFDKIGGRDRMAQWAEENLTEFYRLYGRLIPTESIAEITFRDARELTDEQLLAIATGSGDGIAETTGSLQESGEVH